MKNHQFEGNENLLQLARESNEDSLKPLYRKREQGDRGMSESKISPEEMDEMHEGLLRAGEDRVKLPQIDFSALMPKKAYMVMPYNYPEKVIFLSEESAIAYAKQFVIDEGLGEDPEGPSAEDWDEICGIEEVEIKP